MFLPLPLTIDAEAEGSDSYEDLIPAGLTPDMLEGSLLTSRLSKRHAKLMIENVNGYLSVLLNCIRSHY